jgi:hypothetical protein
MKTLRRLKQILPDEIFREPATLEKYAGPGSDNRDEFSRKPAAIHCCRITR